jgi:hypothetical protein
MARFVWISDGVGFEVPHGPHSLDASAGHMSDGFTAGWVSQVTHIYVLSLPDAGRSTQISQRVAGYSCTLCSLHRHALPGRRNGSVSHLLATFGTVGITDTLLKCVPSFRCTLAHWTHRKTPAHDPVSSQIASADPAPPKRTQIHTRPSGSRRFAVCADLYSARRKLDTPQVGT